MRSMRGTRRRWIGSLALASLALAAFAGCAKQEETGADAIFVDLTDAAYAFDTSLHDHDARVLAARSLPELASIERADARALRGTTDDIVRSLYAIEGCGPEHRARQTVFLSELMGKADALTDAHVDAMSDAASIDDAMLEEDAYQIAMDDVARELFTRLDVAREEPGIRSIHHPCPTPVRPDRS